MRYRLGTLLVVLGVAPLVLAVMWRVATWVYKDPEVIAITFTFLPLFSAAIFAAHYIRDRGWPTWPGNSFK